MVNGNKSLYLTVALALFSLVISGTSTYCNNNKETASKVAVLETQTDYTKAALQAMAESQLRIESKLERMDDKAERNLQTLREQVNALQSSQRREGWTYTPPKNAAK